MTAVRGPRKAVLRAPALLMPVLLAIGATGVACRSKTRLSAGDAAVVVSQAPVVAAGGLTEQEPNGESGAPMVLDLAAGAVSLGGSLGDDDDEDRFLVELPVPGAAPGTPPPAPAHDAAPPLATKLLAVEITPAEGLATALVVQDITGALRGRSQAPAGQPHGLPNLALAPGDRVVLSLKRTGKRVAAGPGSGYQLVVKLGDKGAADESEPNDSVPQATPLAPAHTGPEIAGFLGSREDVDWFRVPTGEIAETTVLTVELELPPEVAASLTVHDQNLGRLAGAKARKGTRLVLRQIAPPPPPGFLVAVKAEGAGDRTHRYLLRVRAEDGPAGEREPNDEPARATPIGEGTSLGYLPAGDVDCFKVEARRGQPLGFTLAPPKRADLVLELLPPGGSKWLRADAGKRGGPETLALTPDDDGAVMVRVSAKREADGDDEPYRMTVDPNAAPQAQPGAPR